MNQTVLIKSVRGLFVPLLLCLFTVSCEHPEFPISVERGNLEVSIYQIEHLPFSSLTRAEAQQAFSRLCFAVYDSLGTRVKQINQLADDKDFGTAVFQLSPAQYRVVVVAHSSDGNPTMTNPSKIQFKNSQGYSDTFSSNDTVVVVESGSKLPVSLSRITSLCRFVVADTIPKGVSKLHFYYQGGSGAFDAATGLGCVKSKQVMNFTAQAGQDSTYYDLYTFLSGDEGDLDLQVTAHDENDNVLNSREFKIPMKRRMVTRVTGNYFTGSGSTSGISITVGLNTDWEGEQEISY